MKPIDFGGQRSKVKVIMDIYGNKLVNTKETKQTNKYNNAKRSIPAHPTFVNDPIMTFTFELWPQKQ